MRHTSSAVLAFVEAAYRVEQSEGAWLEGVIAAAGNLFGVPAAAYFVDASTRGAFATRGYVHQEGGASPEAFAAWERDTPVDVKVHVHLHAPWNFGSLIPEIPAPGGERPIENTIRAHKYPELLGMNALDCTGQGCALVMRWSEPVRMNVDARRSALYDRLVAHVATGARLLRNTRDNAAPEPVAVLSPDGKLHHAAPVAHSDLARETLRDAAVRIDRARAKTFRLDDEGVTTMWQALVLGRWTLTDQFDRDGRRYYVARNNKPESHEPELTSREAAVASAAALGHSNKMIAYELGVSLSTVATHLKRAAQKLGVSSRVELIRALRARP